MQRGAKTQRMDRGRSAPLIFLLVLPNGSQFFRQLYSVPSIGMNNKTPSTSLRAITRLYKEAKELITTDPVRAGEIAEDARQRLLLRSRTSTLEQRKLADLLLLLARSERRITHSDTALEYAKEALRVFESLGIIEEQVWALNAIGVIYWMKGEPPVAHEFFSKCLELLSENSSPILKSSVLSNMGMICWYLGRYDDALRYMQRGLAIDTELRNYQSMSSTLLNIGNVYSNNGDDVHALEFYFKGITVVETHFPEKTVEISLFLTAIGSVFLRAGEYDRALEYYLRGLAIAEKAENQDGMAVALLNIGLVYKENAMLQRAWESATRSLAIRQTMKDDAGSAECLTNLATILLELGKPDEALAYAQQCIDICTANGNKRVLSYALVATGQVLEALGMNDEAIARFGEALSLCREIHYDKGEIAVNINLGRAFDCLGRSEESNAHLQKALLLAKKIEEKPLLLRVHRALTDICEKRGEFAEALEHSKQAYELNSVLYNEKSERRMQMLQVIHQVEEARREAESYRVKTAQLEQKVEEQSRTVAAKTLHLSQRVDVLHRIKKMLASTFAAPQEDVRKGIRQVIAVIDSALADEGFWDSFEAQFQQLHPTFVEVLMARWPALSIVEVRVCSLLRLNLSSKEICRILNIAPRSVDVYRHRIRKKLVIGSEENLTTFLAGIS